MSATCYTGTRVMKIVPEGVLVQKDGREFVIEADSVVCALGFRAPYDVVDALCNEVDESYIIGDCANVGQNWVGIQVNADGTIQVCPTVEHSVMEHQMKCMMRHAMAESCNEVKLIHQFWSESGNPWPKNHRPTPQRELRIDDLSQLPFSITKEGFAMPQFTRYLIGMDCGTTNIKAVVLRNVCRSMCSARTPETCQWAAL